MRLQLIGSYSLDELLEAVSVIVEDLRSSDVDSLKHINIYGHLFAKDRPIEFTENGSEVEHMVYDLSRRRQIALSSGKMANRSINEIKQQSNGDDET